MNKYLTPLLVFALLSAGCATNLFSGSEARDRRSLAEVPAVAASERPNFTGDWVLDPAASGDVRKQLRPGRWDSLFGDGDADSGSGILGHGPGRGIIRHLQARELLIDHRDPVFSISPDNGTSQRVYTDGRGTSVSALGDKSQVVSVAGWEGAVLVVETHAGGNRMVDRYRLLAHPRELEVITELPDWSGKDGPLRVRRVFVPKGSPMQPGPPASQPFVYGVAP
jgi:hypothetical protein